MTMRRSYDTYNRPLIMRASHAGLDFLFIVLMLILLLIAIYMELDLTSVYQEADPKQWVQYKPDFPEEVETFEELQEKNPDVIGWLTIYDTNIDYPLLFPSDGDNNYYLSHDPVKKIQPPGPCTWTRETPETSLTSTTSSTAIIWRSTRCLVTSTCLSTRSTS